MDNEPKTYTSKDIEFIEQVTNSNNQEIITLQLIVFALLKVLDKKAQESLLAILSTLPNPDSVPEQAKIAYRNALRIVSTQIASNDPEDLRKSFSVIPGGKNKTCDPAP